jgi:ferritin-like metal-binding protein YciE
MGKSYMGILSKHGLKNDDSFQNLYINELCDLFSAESQIIETLPTMMDDMNNIGLKSALQEHLETTKEQQNRLQEISNRHDVKADTKICQCIKWIISEGKQLIENIDDPDVMVAVLLSIAQRVEHYEIAGYDSVRK